MTQRRSLFARFFFALFLALLAVAVSLSSAVEGNPLASAESSNPNATISQKQSEETAQAKEPKASVEDENKSSGEKNKSPEEENMSSEEENKSPEEENKSSEEENKSNEKVGGVSPSGPSSAASSASASASESGEVKAKKHEEEIPAKVVSIQDSPLRSEPRPSSSPASPLLRESPPQDDVAGRKEEDVDLAELLADDSLDETPDLEVDDPELASLERELFGKDSISTTPSDDEIDLRRLARLVDASSPLSAATAQRREEVKTPNQKALDRLEEQQVVEGFVLRLWQGHKALGRALEDVLRSFFLALEREKSREAKAAAVLAVEKIRLHEKKSLKPRAAQVEAQAELQTLIAEHRSLASRQKTLHSRLVQISGDTNAVVKALQEEAEPLSIRGALDSANGSPFRFAFKGMQSQLARVLKAFSKLELILRHVSPKKASRKKRQREGAAKKRGEKASGEEDLAGEEESARTAFLLDTHAGPLAALSGEALRTLSHSRSLDSLVKAHSAFASDLRREEQNLASASPNEPPGAFFGTWDPDASSSWSSTNSAPHLAPSNFQTGNALRFLGGLLGSPEARVHSRLFANPFERAGELPPSSFLEFSNAKATQRGPVEHFVFPHSFEEVSSSKDEKEASTGSSQSSRENKESEADEDEEEQEEEEKEKESSRSAEASAATSTTEREEEKTKSENTKPQGGPKGSEKERASMKAKEEEESSEKERASMKAKEEEESSEKERASTKAKEEEETSEKERASMKAKEEEESSEKERASMKAKEEEAAPAEKQKVKLLKDVVGKSCEEIQDPARCLESPNCFHDFVYGVCFFNCTTVTDPDQCASQRFCRFEEVLPHRACVNEGYQSTAIDSQSFVGILRGCEEFRSKEACDWMDAHASRQRQTASSKASTKESKPPSGGVSSSDSAGVSPFHCKWLDKAEGEGELLGGSAICANVREAPTPEKLLWATLIAQKEKALRESELSEGVDEEALCRRPRDPLAVLSPDKPFYSRGSVLRYSCLPGAVFTGVREEVECKEGGSFQPSVRCVEEAEFSPVQLQFIRKKEERLHEGLGRSALPPILLSLTAAIALLSVTAF